MDEQLANYQLAVTMLAEILTQSGFTSTRECPPDKKHMGAWLVQFESLQFVVHASQDRVGDSLGVCLRVNNPRKPHEYGWSLGHLRGYLNQAKQQYSFRTHKEQFDWLRDNLNKLLDAKMLNSKELEQWAREQADRMWGPIKL